ncbi:hypothetical protein [Bacillus sp. Bos-x628]|uniref:hypothetical protein n=1 Tax=Bacillus maqinnsis TaxID=3229854 RepID=UPI00339073CC
MKKSTVLVIKVWEDGNRFNIHINELGVMLSVNKDKQTQSHAKIEKWINEPEKSFITPLFRNDSQENL